MLAIAERYESQNPIGIRYLLDDAQGLSTFADGIFDGVTCNLALMDIPDLRSTFRAVHRVLRSKGWFTVVVIHPCFETPDSDWLDEPGSTSKRVIGSYFQEGFWRSKDPNGVRSRVGTHHRTLSTYVNLLIGSEFTIDWVTEPPASGKIAERVPGLQEIPALFGLRCYRD